MVEQISGPGILWVNSRVTDPATLPADAFIRWYEDVHIPDILAAKPGAVPAAWRYECADHGRPSPYLVVYSFPNLAFLDSAEFKAIPISHPSLPGGGGPIARFARFDVMFAGHPEVWKRAKARPDEDEEHGPILVSEVIVPKEDMVGRFHDWYRQTYVKEISQVPGWRRTARFENLLTRSIKAGANGLSTSGGQRKWLTLHEFDAGSFGDTKTLSSLLGQSEETKEMERSADKVDVALFHLERSFGDNKAAWVDSHDENEL